MAGENNTIQDRTPQGRPAHNRTMHKYTYSDRTQRRNLEKVLGTVESVK